MPEKHFHKWTLDVKFVPNHDPETLAQGIHGYNHIFGWCSCGKHIDYDEIIYKVNLGESVVELAKGG